MTGDSVPVVGAVSSSSRASRATCSTTAGSSNSSIGENSEQVSSWPTAASWPWLVVIGVTGVVAHFCLTSALRLAPASFVMPIDFARLPLIAVAGAVLYGEAIDAAVLVGAAIIFAGNYINVWSETRRNPR